MNMKNFLRLFFALLLITSVNSSSFAVENPDSEVNCDEIDDGTGATAVTGEVEVEEGGSATVTE